MNTNNTTPLSISLKTIKLIHTLIWIIMFTTVFYVFYSGISANITVFSWLGVGLIIIEGIALLLGKGDCPLHVYAQNITGEKIINDTYLPQWVFFKGYKKILTVVFLIGWGLMLINRF